MTQNQKLQHVSPFWTEPDIVDTFANRDADKRLVELTRTYEKPEEIRVLDLGCAGGRNSVLLASGKFDFHAIDGSRPMISRTRERVAGIIGATEAEQRVKLGSMDDLGSFSDGFFHLIVALGIYHQSVSWDHWRKCISESARVLEVGGLVLISAFTPDSQPDGEPLKPVHEKQNMYEGFSSGPLCLLGQSDHDLAMASLGFGPFAPTETVRVETELGFRYTMNALYRKG